MAGSHTIQISFLSLLRFGLFTGSFLFLLVIALSLERLVAYAESVSRFCERSFRTNRFPNLCQYKMTNLGDFWLSLVLSEIQQTLHLIVQSRFDPSTSSLRKPLLTKVIA